MWSEWVVVHYIGLGAEGKRRREKAEKKIGKTDAEDLTGCPPGVYAKYISADVKSQDLDECF